MVQVYACEIVKELIAFYKPVLDIKLEFDSIYDQVKAFGDHAYQLFKDGDHRSIVEFNNYNPKYIGTKVLDIIKSNPVEKDFLETAAYCFSFQGFDHLEEHGKIPIHTAFEQAVDLLLAGDKVGLIELLDSNPDLLTTNSQYFHRAGLIHYVASNGVEFWRQVVPSNLVEMLEILLSRGADPGLTNNIYGSNSSLIGLIDSSAHPHAAGLATDLIKRLS